MLAGRTWWVGLQGGPAQPAPRAGFEPREALQAVAEIVHRPGRDPEQPGDALARLTCRARGGFHPLFMVMPVGVLTGLQFDSVAVGLACAAGVYIQILSRPELYIEVNHRTGALVMSCMLAREGRPPFVLSVTNAKAYFDPSTIVKQTEKHSLGGLIRLPGIRRRFARFLKQYAEERYLISAQAAVGAGGLDRVLPGL